MRRHKPFTGIAEFYTDPETGYMVANDRGAPATDKDVERFYRQAEPDLDRLTLQMCTAERATGNRIPEWLRNAEDQAFIRSLKRDPIQSRANV